MDTKKKIALAVLITFILTTVLYAAAFTVIPAFDSMLGNVRAYIEGNDNEELVSKIREVNRYVDDYYIYDVNKQTMNDLALTGYVAGLGDKYTEYISKDNYKLFTEMVTGDYKGIGVEFFVDYDNLITVLTVFDNTPAANAGIKPFDKIIEVDGNKVSYDNYSEALNMMKGEGKYSGKGDDFTLKIRRGEKEFEVNLTRTEIVAHTVLTKMLKKDIGYIRILNFDRTTIEDFQVRLEKIIADGAKSLIIDLRENPGGTLPDIVGVADILLPEGKIMTVKGKDGQEVVYRSDENEIDMPMCVLINKNTASASEVLASAMRDHKKATLIGETSYGKGVVQSVFPLSDGSYLKITTEEYFTPSGESIHEKGITPDYEIKLESEISIFALSENEDTQLKKAIEILSE